MKKLVILLAGIALVFASCEKMEPIFEEAPEAETHVWGFVIEVPNSTCDYPYTSQGFSDELTTTGFYSFEGTEEEAFQNYELLEMQLRNNVTSFSVNLYRDLFYFNPGHEYLVNSMPRTENMEINILIFQDETFITSKDLTLYADYHPHRDVITSEAGDTLYIQDSIMNINYIPGDPIETVTYDSSSITRSLTFNNLVDSTSVDVTITSTFINQIDSIWWVPDPIDTAGGQWVTVTEIDTAYQYNDTTLYFVFDSLSATVSWTEWTYFSNTDRTYPLVADTTWTPIDELIFLPPTIERCDSIPYVR